MKKIARIAAVLLASQWGLPIDLDAQNVAIKTMPGELVIENPTLINLGFVLPNITDKFAGRAPDLGALEYGHTPPHYGPRP